MSLIAVRYILSESVAGNHCLIRDQIPEISLVGSVSLFALVTTYHEFRTQLHLNDPSKREACAAPYLTPQVLVVPTQYTRLYVSVNLAPRPPPKFNLTAVEMTGRRDSTL